MIPLIDYNLTQKLQEGIRKLIHKEIKDTSNNFHLDNYYLDGVIIAVNGDGTYNVKINNDTYNNLKTDAGKTFVLNDIVYVMVVNSNKSRMFIDRKRIV